MLRSSWRLFRDEALSKRISCLPQIERRYHPTSFPPHTRANEDQASSSHPRCPFAIAEYQDGFRIPDLDFTEGVSQSCNDLPEVLYKPGGTAMDSSNVVQLASSVPEFNDKAHDTSTSEEFAVKHVKSICEEIEEHGDFLGVPFNYDVSQEEDFTELPLRTVEPPAKKPGTGFRGHKDKFVSITHHLPDIGDPSKLSAKLEFERLDQEWLDAYAIINAIHRSDLPQPEIEVPSSVTKFSAWVQWEQRRSKKELIEEVIAQLWDSQPLKWKRVWWQKALLYSLLMSPRAALYIVDDICKQQHLQVPVYVLVDVFNHVITTELENTGNPVSSVNRMLRSIRFYLSRYSQPTRSRLLSQRTIWNVSKYCDATQLDQLIEALQKSNAVVDTDTKLHIMTKYVTLDRLGSALELLRTIPEEDFRLNANRIQSVCVLILRAPWDVEDLYGLRNRILSFMLELGISPNRQLHNVVLLNAMEAGDRALAWKSYLVTRQNGLLPNAYTYSILLKGVEHGDDLSTIYSIYQESKKDGTLMISPRLASHLLWAIYSFYRARGQPAFNSMFALYVELFDTAPLVDLGILHPSFQQQNCNHIVMPPSEHALQWLLLAWMKENASNQAQIRELYDSYLKHTTNDHPAIAQLAASTITATGFILAFGQSLSTLQMCTTVAQNLLKPPRPQPEVELAHLSPHALESETQYSTPETGEAGMVKQTDAQSSAVKSSSALSQSPVQADHTPRTATNEEIPLNSTPTTGTSTRRADPRKHYNPTTPLLSLASPKSLYPTAPPGIYVWNALVYVFARHKQVDAAERIMKLMQSHGVSPDKMTWDHLVCAYACTQDPAKVVEAVERMGKQNFKPDERTMKSLSFVVDRRSLLEGFERAAKKERELEAEELEAREREGYEKWFVGGLEGWPTREDKEIE